MMGFRWRFFERLSSIFRKTAGSYGSAESFIAIRRSSKSHSGDLEDVPADAPAVPAGGRLGRVSQGGLPKGAPPWVLRGISPERSRGAPPGALRVRPVEGSPGVSAGMTAASPAESLAGHRRDLRQGPHGAPGAPDRGGPGVPRRAPGFALGLFRVSAIGGPRWAATGPWGPLGAPGVRPTSQAQGRIGDGGPPVPSPSMGTAWCGPHSGSRGPLSGSSGPVPARAQRRALRPP